MVRATVTYPDGIQLTYIEPLTDDWAETRYDACDCAMVAAILDWHRGEHTETWCGGTAGLSLDSLLSWQFEGMSMYGEVCQ